MKSYEMLSKTQKSGFEALRSVFAPVSGPFSCQSCRLGRCVQALCVLAALMSSTCSHAILSFSPVRLEVKKQCFEVDTATSATRGTRYIWLEEDVIKGLVDLGQNFGDSHLQALCVFCGLNACNRIFWCPKMWKLWKACTTPSKLACEERAHIRRPELGHFEYFWITDFFSWFALHHFWILSFISFYATCCWKVVGISEVLDLKEKWDNYVASWRKPSTVGQAFHVRPSDSKQGQVRLSSFQRDCKENLCILLWFYEYI